MGKSSFTSGADLESPIGTLSTGPVGGISGIGGKTGRELLEEVSAGMIVEARKNRRDRIPRRKTIPFMAKDRAKRPDLLAAKPGKDAT
jgi:hypothetical protein